MAPLSHLSNSPTQMDLNPDESENEIVEVDLKWQSPTSSNKSSAKSPSMPRRSDPSLDLVGARKSSRKSGFSHSLSPKLSTTPRKAKSKSLNLDLNMSFSSFTALVEDGISPPPKMPHRRGSTDNLEGLPVVSDGQGNNNNKAGGKEEDFYMDLNDAKGASEKKKIRRVRRGIHRAFSDSELSEASSINSQESKKAKMKARKKNQMKKRTDRFAEKLFGKGKSGGSNRVNEEDDDVVDTEKDLEGFTGVFLKKSNHSTSTSTRQSGTSYGTDDTETVGTKKTQSEIELETRSRASKSTARFPTRDRSRSRGRPRRASTGSSSAAAANAAAAEAVKKKKKKRNSVSRTKRSSNRKVSSDASSDEEYEKLKTSSKSRKSKSPGRRRKSAGAAISRRLMKGTRKQIQPPPRHFVPNDDSMSQRTMTDLVIDVLPAQEFVSPCTIGSGRRSIFDSLTPTTRSRDSRVSAITMSTHSFSPFMSSSNDEDFSNHSAFTQSSLRGPQHIPRPTQIPDLEASERASERQANSLLVTGNLSAVFETSSRTDGLGLSGRDVLGFLSGRDGLVLSGRDVEDVAPAPPPAAGAAQSTPRSSLRMPAKPKRRGSTDYTGQGAFINKDGPLFDASQRSEKSGNNEQQQKDEEPTTMTKQKSSSDLMGQAKQEDRPNSLLRKAASDRKVSSPLSTNLWRRGKKKKSISLSPTEP